jgi:hypothetical protein
MPDGRPPQRVGGGVEECDPSSNDLICVLKRQFGIVLALSQDLAG